VGGARKRAAVLAIAAVGSGDLAAPACAEHDIFLAYREVSEAVRPAGLVATTFPRAMGPVGSMLLEVRPGRKGSYVVEYNHFVFHGEGRASLAGHLLVGSLGPRSLSAEARSARARFSEQPTVVRGRRALLLRSRRTGALALLWSEARRLYEVETFTPRAVSVNDLRGVAASLGHVLGVLVATPASRESSLGSAHAVVSERTVILGVRWTAPCIAKGGGLPPPPAESDGSAVMALTAGGFSLPPTLLPRSPGPERVEGEPAAWTLSLGGSLSAGAATVTLQATGEGPGMQCATAPTTLQLAAEP
jgi:hypothetical protein